jgi:hypothetical protein
VYQQTRKGERIVITIQIVMREEDPRVYQIRDSVPGTSREMLFDGNRWKAVTRVALAMAKDGTAVGLGTLSPTTAMGLFAPSIFGFWVKPAFRYQGTALAIVKTLAAECQRLYDVAPRIEVFSTGGLAVCRRAEFEDVQLNVVDATKTISDILP